MKLMTQSYNNGGSTYNAEAEETAFLSYRIEQRFNGPAECWITLGDPTGSIAQKYAPTANAVFIGAGKATVEDPTATDLFFGRILKATADTGSRTVTLYCQDWLCQLDDEQIDYDMREDLDGSGLRQSTISPDFEDQDGNGIAPLNVVGGPAYLVYDSDMSWDADAFNDMNLILLNSMAGVNTWATGPYTETVTPSAAPMAVDGTIPAGGGLNFLWKDDGEYKTLSDSADYYVDYGFEVWVPDSSFFSSIEGARIRLKYRGNVASDITLQVKHNASYTTIGELAQDTTADDAWAVFDIPENLLADLFDADGRGTVRIRVDAATGGTLRLYYIMYEIDTTTTGYSTAIAISDTATRVAVNGAVADDGGAETDETTEANNPTANDMTLLPATPAVGDTYLFGSKRRWKKLHLNIGTAGVGTWTIVWEYSQGADAWAALADVVDNTDAFTVSGTNTVGWTIPSDWEQEPTATAPGSVDNCYWVRARVSAYTDIDTQPLGTQAWNEVDCRMIVGTDLSADATKVWDGCPYSIARKQYEHIASDETPGALITDGDTMEALTCAATIEHTPGVSTKQHIKKTRLQILGDEARQAKAQFWITLGGVIVTWQSTFTANPADETLTDTDVNAWSSTLDWSTVANKVIVEGMRIGDEQLSKTYSDATSIAKYKATRTRVVKESGIVSEYDALAKATAIANQYKDAQRMLTATIAGNTALAAHDKTIKLGDEISITSTYFNMTAEFYIVAGFKYDSDNHETTLDLHPRVSQVGLQEQLEKTGMERSLQMMRRGTADTYVPEPAEDTI